MLRALVLIVGAALACPASNASASPYEDTALGGAVFTGPVQGHPTAFFVNPAALGLTGRGWHLYLGGSSRLDSMWVRRREVDPATLELRAGERFSNHTLSPGGLIAAYGSFQGNDARFGLSMYAPNLQRFPKGDPAFQYYTEGGYLSQVMLTMAGSVRFGGRLLVGLGVSLGYSTARLTFARDTALEGGSDGIASDCSGEPCGFENPAAAEHYHVDVGTEASFGEIFTLKNLSASVGAAFELRPDMWIALSYVALPGAFGTLSLSGQAIVDRSARDGGGSVEGRAEVGFRMPQMVFLGFRMPAIGDYHLISNLRWSDLSRHDQFDIRLFGGELPEDVPEWYPRFRGLHDTWRLGVGLESSSDQTLRTGVRARLETSALLDERTNPIQISPFNATLGTGAELRFAEHFVLSLGYEITWYPVLDIENSAFDPVERLECIDSQYDFDLCAGTRDGRSMPTAAGRYRRIRHGVLLSIGYDSL